MLKNNCIKLVAGLFALGAGLWAQDAKADSAADFYKGKTVNILVGFGSGGSYGVYARLLADAFARHIPGNPKVIPQFMPGGGSRKAINFLYNAAPRTGTHVGMGIPQLAFNQLIFPKGIKFDMRKFNFIGRITDGNVIFMLRSDAPGGGTLAGAMKSQVIIGGSGKGTHTYMIPAVMNSLLGTKFKIVLGYKGSRAEWLAMERNEIHGMTGSWLNWKSRKAELDQDQVHHADRRGRHEEDTRGSRRASGFAGRPIAQGPRQDQGGQGTACPSSRRRPRSAAHFLRRPAFPPTGSRRYARRSARR